jgi:hypothetical protein
MSTLPSETAELRLLLPGELRLLDEGADWEAGRAEEVLMAVGVRRKISAGEAAAVTGVGWTEALRLPL